VELQERPCYATVLLGRITGLSVCPSVWYGLLPRKRHKKPNWCKGSLGQE